MALTWKNGITYLDAFLAGTADNVGTYFLEITATDDGTPSEHNGVELLG